MWSTERIGEGAERGIDIEVEVMVVCPRTTPHLATYLIHFHFYLRPEKRIAKDLKSFKSLGVKISMILFLRRVESDSLR